MTTTKSDDSWTLVVVPRKSTAAETFSDLRGASRALNVGVELGLGPDILHRKKGRSVCIVTALHLLQTISQRDPKTPLSGVDLVVLDHLEQLDSVYELSVSLLRHATQTSTTRFVGLSHSLIDPTDLALWLNVDPFSLFSFRPSDRGQSLTMSTQTFTIPQSASLFKAMSKPAHAAIREAPLEENAIVFVPSRGQCRPIAFDLITQCALESETDKGYLPDTVPEHYLEDYLARLRDPALIDFVSRGVGLFHDGLQKSDRNIILELYAEGIVRVLIVPRESCWSLPVRSAVVVVMGTQYLELGAEGTDRHLREYDLTELVHMQSRAIRHAGSGHFHLFCQAENKDTILRFLNEGLSLESKILETRELETWHRQRQKTSDKQQIIDALSLTYLARRIITNPAYYDCTSDSRDENLSRIVDKLAVHTIGARQNADAPSGQ